jgi:hypothetical protein
MGPAIGIAIAALVLLCMDARAAQLVYNGSFEQVRASDGAPEGWLTQGHPEIQQQLTVVSDPERGQVAKLECAHFVPGFPDSHAMLAQRDRIGLKAGQWYRLRFWARAVGPRGVGAEVGLRGLGGSGRPALESSFLPAQKWQPFEFTFRPTADLEPQGSRLQIWFAGTGTLLVDDVALEAVEEPRRQWQPALSLGGVRNALPNSSFECGGSGWGCWTPSASGWGGQVFQRMGEWDQRQACHGSRSWKLSLSPDSIPTWYFDYYDPVQSRVRALLLGHDGWVSVERGQPYVFSAHVLADRPGVPVRIVIAEAEGPSHERAFSASTEWQRFELSFTARRDSACAYVGLDLREVNPPEGAVWLDALQFEQGQQASAYVPREEMESRLETDATGNIFAKPDDGLSFRLRAFNSGADAQALRGKLALTDYLDRSVWEQQVSLLVAARGGSSVEYRRVLPGRRGFFRLRWEPEGGMAQCLRCAVIEPSPEEDSLFGMNHAFPWEFLLRLGHQAGLRWWRDWSVKWQTVQPQPGAFDFSVPDAQITRVVNAGGRMVVLLPFPSAVWATKPDAEKVAAIAGDNEYLKRRLPTSFKPERIEQFATYVRESVAHYRGTTEYFEILNEPLFTDYAVPARFGYSTADYIELLRAAYTAAKEADPDCVVIGGISAPPNLRWVAEFIRQGGLRWCDIANYHMYPRRGWAENCESDLKVRWEEMAARGETKPIWFTELGIYGDDGPPYASAQVGDAAMSGATRPSELEASADIVRFTALLCAYGVRKVFYHAGTCAAMHASSAGNMFLRYGGEPFKQYAAQAALSRLMGPDVQFVRKWDAPDWLRAYEFRSRGRRIVIAWTRQADAPPLVLPDGLKALDLMGNPMPGRQLQVGEMPVYLVSE